MQVKISITWKFNYLTKSLFSIVIINLSLTIRKSLGVSNFTRVKIEILFFA